MLARKMAQDTLDLLVPIADRRCLGDLRRRLEDTCRDYLNIANVQIPAPFRVKCPYP